MTERPDDDILWLSMLEHTAYCPRQTALIHNEQTFTDNVYTVQGNLVHERVEAGGSTSEGAIRVERHLPLWSEELGLRGIADVVEFDGEVPYPIEYKRSRIRRAEAAEIQLCAQGMCLEEMFGLPVPKGAIYHAGSNRRREVVFTETLRQKVVATIQETRRIIQELSLPPPVNDSRCRHCSLKEACLPEMGQWLPPEELQGGL